MFNLLKVLLTWFMNTVLGKFLIVGLIGGIVKIAVGLGLAHVIAVLAIGTITFTGSMFTIDWVITQIQSNLSLLDVQTYQLVSMVASRLQFDAAFSLILTAYASVMAVWTFKGVWKMFGFGGGQ